MRKKRCSLFVRSDEGRLLYILTQNGYPLAKSDGQRAFEEELGRRLGNGARVKVVPVGWDGGAVLVVLYYRVSSSLEEWIKF